MVGGEHSAPPLRITDQIFAVGHEPVGVRVTPYHKPHAIRQILNSVWWLGFRVVKGLLLWSLGENGNSV
ncbi:hypothetical protein Bca4012_084182 [Brassica carinata]|uniref:Uncharacterized protein n=1 Tax=Brassica carinata TaxID=52824 RepID=A0A8X7SGZ5_BRACI|nr:hypothetical protein Bca52824_026607 [Brassica carinata]